MNLLTNALKFTHAGGSVKLGGSFDGTYVTVYVQDSGDGISAEDKPKLFKLFGKIKQKRGVNS